MYRLSNLGKQFAVCAIDDFRQFQSQYVRHHVVKLFVNITSRTSYQYCQILDHCLTRLVQSTLGRSNENCCWQRMIISLLLDLNSFMKNRFIINRNSVLILYNKIIIQQRLTFNLMFWVVLVVVIVFYRLVHYFNNSSVNQFNVIIFTKCKHVVAVY